MGPQQDPRFTTSVPARATLWKVTKEDEQHGWKTVKGGKEAKKDVRCKSCRKRWALMEERDVDVLEVSST